MPIFNGVDNIANIYQGNNQIVKVYQGANLKYELSLFGAYELLGEITLSSSTNAVDFTNLNITKDDSLQLVSTAVGDITGDNSSGFLYVNNNTTGSNYTGQLIEANGSGLQSVRFTNPIFLVARSNKPSGSLVNIKISNNDRFVYQASFTRDIGDTSNIIEQFHTNAVSNFTVSSITSINIRGSRNWIVGTKFQLYKVNKGVA